MRWLLVRDDRVVNVVVWDGVEPWDRPGDVEVLEAPDGVGVGFTWDGITWNAPPPPVYPDPEEGAEQDSTA